MIVERQEIKEAPRTVRRQIEAGRQDGREFICLEKVYLPDYCSETPIIEYKLVELIAGCEGETDIIINVFSSKYDYIPVMQQEISFSLEVLGEINKAVSEYKKRPKGEPPAMIIY